MKKLRLSKYLKIGAPLVIVIGLLSFSERQMSSGDNIQSIEVEIFNNHDNHYLDESDVIADINNVLSNEGEDVNLKHLENTLYENPYIKETQVFKDLKNHLLVKVTLRRPLARLVRKKRSHAYISYDGYILPISTKYTSRVPIITGAYAEDFTRENIHDDEKDLKLFDLLNKIDQDQFFKAQVAQLDVDSRLNINIYPQVTKQIIEFGQPEDIEEKFRKLMIFYRQILPQKGWNSYERVNVKFKGQIVAE